MKTNGIFGVSGDLAEQLNFGSGGVCGLVAIGHGGSTLAALNILVTMFGLQRTRRSADLVYHRHECPPA